MKKLVILILSFILCSVTCNLYAQYKYKVTLEDLNGNVVSETEKFAFNINDDTDYNKALEQIRSGKTLFWIGTGIVAVAGGLRTAAIITEREYFSLFNGSPGCCVVLGSYLVGGIFQIIGASNWISGTKTAGRIRYEYSLQGIILNF